MTDEQPRPHVELSFARMFCPIHGEPFREQWPRGAIIFQLKALESIFDSEAFWTEIEDRFGVPVPVKSAPDAAVPHELVGKAFDIKPVCCRLGGEALLATYEWQATNGGIGAKGFCCAPRCGRFALGTAIRNGAQRVPHICFRCMAMYAVPADS